MQMEAEALKDHWLKLGQGLKTNAAGDVKVAVQRDQLLCC